LKNGANVATPAGSLRAVHQRGKPRTCGTTSITILLHTQPRQVDTLVSKPKNVTAEELHPVLFGAEPLLAATKVERDREDGFPSFTNK
jgi:hypothetical protein